MTTNCGQCHACLAGKEEVINGYGFPVAMLRMIVCETCGNKRCPHATDCQFDCTNSNEPGQPGSVYGPFAAVGRNKEEK